MLNDELTVSKPQQIILILRSAANFESRILLTQDAVAKRIRSLSVTLGWFSHTATEGEALGTLRHGQHKGEVLSAFPACENNLRTVAIRLAIDFVFRKAKQGN